MAGIKAYDTEDSIFEKLPNGITSFPGEALLNKCICTAYFTAVNAAPSMEELICRTERGHLINSPYGPCEMTSLF